LVWLELLSLALDELPQPAKSKSSSEHRANTKDRLGIPNEASVKACSGSCKPSKGAKRLPAEIR
jgi:hypothetical protein